MCLSVLCLWKLCFLLQRGGGDGIQPERLNAEGDSPSALSRGLSVSATPGTPAPIEKASERRENSCQGSRFSRLSDASRKMLRYRGLRFAPPSAKSHSLCSGFRPFRSCCGVFNTDYHKQSTDKHNIVKIRAEIRAEIRDKNHR